MGRVSTSLLFLLPVVVVLVIGGASTLGCKRTEKDPRARELPVTGSAEEGVESRFRVREMPVGGCKSAPCDVLMTATDAETGNQVVIKGLELPETMPNTGALRGRILNGELLVIGSIAQRFRADTIQGKSTPPDAGATDLVLYARDTAPPPSATAAAAKPMELALYSCAGSPQSSVKIALDGSDVYFAGCGTIGRVPKAGGGAVVVAEETVGQDFVVDDAFVYWWAFRAFALVKTPKAGGADVKLAPGAGGFELVLDGSDLYYLRRVGMNTTQVVRLPKTGGTEVIVASSDEFVTDLAVDATHAYVQVTTRVGTVQSIARAPKSGGPLTDVFKAKSVGGEPLLVNPFAIHLAGDSIFWANGSGYSPVTSATKTGRSMAARFSLEKSLPVALTIAGDDIYATSFDHRLFRTSKSGPSTHFPSGNLDPLAREEGTHARSDVAVDDAYVYWMHPLAPRSLSVDVLTRQPR